MDILKRREKRSLYDVVSNQTFSSSLSSAATAPSFFEDRDQLPAQCQVLCIASGKGGTGKTTLTTNLAVCLAQKGFRVLLVDADLGMANAHLLMGLRPQADISHVLEGSRKIDEVLVEGPCGIHLVPGGSGLSHLSDLHDCELRSFASSLFPLESQWDIVLIDLAAGISPQVMRFLEPAHEVLLVTNPEVTALMDAYALLKSLVALRADGPLAIRCVLNRVRDENEAKNALQKLRYVTSRHLPTIQISSWGYVPFDRYLLHSITVRRPVVLLHPHSFVVKCLDHIACRIENIHLLWRNQQQKELPARSYFAELQQQIYE